MFSYLGSKSKFIEKYPKPLHDTIIEPFAGSARYSLLYHECNVQLYDISRYVVETWRYLIDASPKDVLSLPLIPDGQTVDDFNLTDGEKYLIGFHLCRGKSKPRRRGYGRNGWVNDRKRIAELVPLVKHWNILQESFETINPAILNLSATWFIGPPYEVMQTKSDRYPHWCVDYDAVKRFIYSRRGQVIACGNHKDSYIKFPEFISFTNSTSGEMNIERALVFNNP